MNTSLATGSAPSAIASLPTRSIIGRMAFLLLMFVSVSGTWAQPSDGPSGDSEKASEKAEQNEKIAVEQTIPDGKIANRVRDLLIDSGLVEAPQVDVRNGIVKLSGEVDSVANQERANQLANRIDGVVEVTSDLTVRGNINFKQSLKTVQISLNNIVNDGLSRLPMIAAGIVVIVLTWAAAVIGRKVVGRILSNNKRIRVGLRDLAQQLVTIGVWTLGLMVAAVVVFPGMTPSKALTVLGLGSVAVGFAFKDIFENFFAGILILWRYPFDRGDLISCNEIRGTVDEVTIRNTVIRQPDGQLVVLPNATLFKNPVNVLTSKQVRRQTIICGVAYDEDVDEAREAIRAAVDQCRTVSGGHDVEVFAREFNSSSVDFEVTWWTGATMFEERKSRDEVIAAVKRALDEAGIEIPFPYRTLVFKKPISFENRNVESREVAGQEA